MTDIFRQVFTDPHFLSAFIQTVIIILLGFFFRRKNLVGSEGKAVLTTLVWKLSVPCFAFNAFMQDFDPVSFSSSIRLFFLAIVFYIILIFTGRLLFTKLGKGRALIAGLFVAIGQTTLFSMPILQSIYDGVAPEVLLYISTISIVFRIFVYIISFSIITGERFRAGNIGSSLKKIFVTPIMIGMFLGIAAFLLQNRLPFLRLDKSMPVPYVTVKSLAQLLSPLTMFLVGLTIGEARFAESLKDRTAWTIALCRNFLAPVILLCICTVLHKSGLFRFSLLSLISIIIGFSAPISVTLSVMCLQAKKEEVLSSRACLISTLLTIVSLPIMFVLCHAFWTYMF